MSTPRTGPARVGRCMQMGRRSIHRCGRVHACEKLSTSPFPLGSSCSRPLVFALCSAEGVERVEHASPPDETRTMTDFSLDAVERERLCDLMIELGPEAPTLLEPWTTHDLAAHLV